MEHISSNTRDYFRSIHRRPPGHEKAAIVDEIIKLAPITAKYGYTYWLSLIKRSGVRFTDIIGILKNIESAPSQYPKGALITNRLVEIARRNQTKKLF